MLHQILTVLNIDNPLMQKVYSGRLNRVFLINSTPRGVLKIYMPFEQNSLRQQKERWAYNAFSAMGLHTPRIKAEGEIEGCPYILMSYLPGRNLRDSWQELTSEEKENIFEQCGTILAKIHKTLITAEQFSLVAESHLRSADISSKIVMLPKVYWKIYQNVLQEYFQQLMGSEFAYMVPTMKKIMEHNYLLLQNASTGLLHGDFQDKNLLVVQGEVTGVLDAEMMHLGFTESELVIENICCYVDFKPEERIRYQQAVFKGYGDIPNSEQFDRIHHIFRLINLVESLIRWNDWAFEKKAETVTSMKARIHYVFDDVISNIKRCPLPM